MRTPGQNKSKQVLRMPKVKVTMANLEDREVKMTIHMCLSLESIARKIRFGVRNGLGRSEPMDEPHRSYRTMNLIPVRFVQNAGPWTDLGRT
jgi:hypothetical protein